MALNNVDYQVQKGVLYFHVLFYMSEAHYFSYCHISTDKIKTFFAEFHKVGKNGSKDFKYATQLTKIAHREQVTKYLLFIFEMLEIMVFVSH